MRVILANENPLIIDQLKKLLKVHRVVSIDSASNTMELTRQLNENEYDLAIIGARLQGTITLELLKGLQNSMAVIITSPDTEDAYPALKAGVMDYLLEPVQLRETAESIKRVMDKLNDNKALGSAAAIAYKKRFLVKIGDKMKAISVRDIAYIFAEGKLIYLVTTAPGRKYIIDHKMDELERTLLDKEHFFRINRKYLVHIDALEEARPYVNSRLKLLLNVPCEQDMIVSREKVVAFKQWLNW